MTVGHNKPPDMAITANETAVALSDWMKENPIIENEDQAREAKVYIDRGKFAIKDLEDERVVQVSPLNEQVRIINDHYRGPRDLLKRVLDELENRITSFLRAEEEKRLADLAEARKAAEAAAERAREAERDEQAAINSAHVGELGVDIATATADADRAFAEYQKAERTAALAEKEAKVKIGGGFSRALSLRGREELEVDDPFAAITDMGLTESIENAIISSARAYKKVNGAWPAGIIASKRRTV